ncbi:MAG: thioredoxin-dependent thiol peroxidase [Planctomycetes bacterium]|nr:thioredoxin-dependent thiol peroxidase [Planctomycetota bacterium]
MLKLGQKAPAFSLPSTSGATVSLAALKGRKVVLYFYPRDNTPGCTTEACDFRDQHSALRKAGAVVLGVSSDSLKSHDGFRAKHALPFDLLVDAGSKVASAYGAFGEKLMYGRKVQGTIRSTFLIDEQGKLAAVWSPVRVQGHVEAVLAALTPTAPAAAKSPTASHLARAKVAQQGRAANRRTSAKR